MKSFIRLGATLGIAGTVFLTGLSGIGNLPGIGNQEAIALPQDQVVKQLQRIPVFTLTNSKGQPVIIESKNASKTISEVVCFISKQDAQKFLDNQLKKQNPQFASTVQVTPWSLGGYYQLVLESKKKSDSMIYTLVPMQQQVASAISTLNQNGQKVQQFNGIPLFIPTLKKDKSYVNIAISQGNEQYFPFFFEKEQAVALLNDFKKAMPQEAANIKIEIGDLSSLLENLNKSNDPNMNKIMLLPSRESLNFIGSLAPNQSPAAKPTAAPVRKK